ncbi:hypothetical protein F2Q68_00033960 [Brassica cretica]|uniref:Uncharacterized protein n=1 Tax=Brassica cretica TaxID=69181 RepID=A0A8S9H5F1_BRACR|nr:hypothetical protein F2Q68_00033960 [Brassica cretica]
MEEATMEPGATDATAETKTLGENQQEGNQFQNPGYQKPYPQNQNQNGKMFILSQAQNQFQNKQNNPQAAPATASGPSDELKGMMQQLLQDDPLEVALIRTESKQNTCNVDADGYEKMLDSSKSIEKMVAFIDDLAAKVDQLLKNNKSQIYVMEEATMEPGATDATAETKTLGENQQEGNQFQNPGYQKPYPQNQNQNGKMFILSQAQNQFQNKQNNPQAAPATASGPSDELKGMMQQLLQGQQIHGKALNKILSPKSSQLKRREDRKRENNLHLRMSLTTNKTQNNQLS